MNKNVFYQFSIPGDFIKAEPYGSGHINDTYSVSVSQAGKPVRYIFQRINDQIFKDVPGLMENIARVTEHTLKKLHESGEEDFSRKTLQLVKTKKGENFLHDQGLYWRAYLFIENAQTYDLIDDPIKAYEAAKSFGKFLKLLADIPGDPLNETIKDFHNSRSRYNNLQTSIQKNTASRASNVQKEIEFFQSREKYVDVVINQLASGELPLRVTHNDTKLNNVMLDNESMTGICVIDLDTLMPGSCLYDFGDMVRTATNAGLEDDKDLSKVFVQLPIFEALVKGYLEVNGKALTQNEIKQLVFAGKIITMNVGMRFLTDYLDGDQYFKTKYEDHNLVRCRTQMALIRSIEGHESEMDEIVKKYAKIYC